jgi:protease-4
MSETIGSSAATPAARPRRSPGLLLLLSLTINLCFFGLLLLACCGGVFFYGLSSEDTKRPLTENFLRGKKISDNKIAVIRLEGVLFEGLLDFYERQIEQAAGDAKVRSVVLRINSPGGSITASDQLFHLISKLRDGEPERNRSPRPVVVSMGSMAASGGYYIAMPAKLVLAERTTMTGSIGVYASFPDVTGLTEKLGVEWAVVKQGSFKYSGSPFQKMSPEETIMWQKMVDHAYGQFVQVVEEGRPKLKGKLKEAVIEETRQTSDKDKEGKTKEKPIKFVRCRADGGLFTADEALKFGLIDKIGYVEEAIKEAANLAKLGEDFKAITYEKPFYLSEILLGGKASAVKPQLDPAGLSQGLTPRLWYLAPQSELAGVLKACQ